MPVEERIHTKVVATLGPASAGPGALEALLDAGVDVCRLNFSHGTLEDHGANLKRIRAWEAEHGQPIAVLGDLCGPKIRLTKLAGEPFSLTTGDDVRIGAGNQPSGPEGLFVTYERLLSDVLVGHRLLIDDGLVRLLVVDRSAEALHCTCTVGGVISSRKGVNLPDSKLATEALTEKDRADLKWALGAGLDYVALSFVRQPLDVLQLRQAIENLGGQIGIISKIEKPEALQHLDELIQLSDGIMVARGDLGVEMDIWRVPLVQKDLTRRCRLAAKPVIIATQMLQSMVASPTPTRAEVSDVANAILDRADAVMLSAESASGQFPLESVDMMQRVARHTEAYLRETRGFRPIEAPAANPATAAIAQAAAQAALQLKCRAVAVWSSSGFTVRQVAQQRLPMPVVGFTYDERVWRQLNLLRGVIPIRVAPAANPAEFAQLIDHELLNRKMVERGDAIVVVTSTNPTRSGQTNTALIHRIGEVTSRERVASYSI